MRVYNRFIAAKHPDHGFRTSSIQSNHLSISSNEEEKQVEKQPLGDKKSLKFRISVDYEKLKEASQRTTQFLHHLFFHIGISEKKNSNFRFFLTGALQSAQSFDTHLFNKTRVRNFSQARLAIRFILLKFQKKKS